MKLPKGFGNMGNLMREAQQAMERAKNMERELAMEEIEVDRSGIKAKFNGTGELLLLKIDPGMVDKDDVEALEDAVLLALREGLAKVDQLRKEKVAEITGGLPMPPGMSPF
jgi:DNA-binding YbaB/EbfC family protein